MKYRVLIVLLFVSMTTQARDYVNSFYGSYETTESEESLLEEEVLPKPQRVTKVGIQLLNTESEFTANTKVDELATFINNTESVLGTSAAKYPDNGEILLRVDLSTTSKPIFTLASKGNITQELLQDVESQLAALSLKTKKSALAFEIHFLLQ